MKSEFNMQIEWQVPQSPKTNMLDLGVWMSLQSYVEKNHRDKVMQSNELAKSVMLGFSQIPTDVLERVHDRRKLVLRLIYAGKGRNDLVEKHRGKKEETDDLPSIPAEIIDVDSDVIRLDDFEEAIENLGDLDERGVMDEEFGCDDEEDD